MDLNLEGRSALVCGSSQGIGLATAIELSELGATVCLFARNEERLKESLKKLKRPAGQKHHYLLADFSKAQEVGTVIQEAIASGARFEILVNNTGGPPGGKISEANIEEFRIAFNNHLINNHQLAQACIPGMKASGYGRIINIISTSVKIPLNGLGVSNTVRGAVANWSKTMANELGQFNITVNNVLPGATNTLRLTTIVENKAKKSDQSTEEVIDQMAAAVPMNRIGEAFEVGAAVAFLASPAASYINGINLPVDGGRTASL
jgi:3-oxoacyl-[acyl-carrier protein] reductase